MPMRILEGFATELSKLRAERSLRHANEIGVGAATLKQREEIVREWRAEAGAGARRLTSVGEAASIAASMGFQVVRDIPGAN